MGTASFAQHSFLGGEWSKVIQGRADRQDYRTAMNLCRNALPIEEGACTRRPGTKQICPTRDGLPGVIREYDYEESLPYLLEFTPGYMRVHLGNDIAVQNTVQVVGFSSGTFTTDIPHGYLAGQEVVFTLVQLVGLFSNLAPLFQKQWKITAASATQFIIVDSLLGVSPTITIGTSILTVSLVTEFVTPYTSDLQSLRLVQTDAQAFILNGSPIQVVTATQSSGEPLASFSFEPGVFLDGPYLDAPIDGSTITVTGSDLDVSIQVSSVASVNTGAGFSGGDIGRHIRLFSQPDNWSSSTAYTAGEIVTYGGSYFTALASTTGNQPDINPTIWAIDPEGAQWTWGVITHVVASDTVLVTLAASYNDAAGNPQASGPVLYPSLPVTLWQLGTYCASVGYPTCGTYHEGRLWLSGAVPNAFDASQSNLVFNFAPTDLYGTVSDNNGISETLNADQINAIFWMIPDHNGIVCGTQGGEWVIQASNQSDPLTPTSIQAHRVTKFGCENIEPRRTGMSLAFVRRYGKKLTEYISDVYSGKYSGTDLSITAAHLMGSGIAEIAYQQETTPVIWVRNNDGSLVGITYRRDSPFGTQPASFAGWHAHSLGTDREIISIQGGPAVGGEYDALSMITQDPSTGFCYLETMTPLFLETDTISDAWFLDGAVNPQGADLETIDGQVFVVFSGLEYYEGQTLSVWFAGVDCGDFIVSSAQIRVPVDNIALGPLTSAQLATVTPAPGRYPTTINGAADEFVYTATASDDFDPVQSNAAQTGMSLYSFFDTPYYPYLYNPDIRTFFWPAIQYYNYVDVGTQLSSTVLPYTLYNGNLSVAPGVANINNARLFVLSKNIDSGDVTAYPRWDASRTVPAGIDSSDGTWRRYDWQYSSQSQGQGYMLDPRTNNIWTFGNCSDSSFSETGLPSPPGEPMAMVLRSEDQYQQAISPAIFPLDSSTYNCSALGTTTKWAYQLFINNTTSAQYINLFPREFTDLETTSDVLQVYAQFEFPIGLQGYFAVQSFNSYTGTNTSESYYGDKMYFVTVQNTGARTYKLYKFDEPTSAVPGTVVGGGFTDITPWTSSTGPNIGATGHTGGLSSGGEILGVFGNVFTSPCPRMVLTPLPAGNQLVLVTKNVPEDLASPSPDPTSLTFDCTYIQLQTDTASLAFDYHPGFVTGWMSADWVATSEADAAYGVQGSLTIDPYISMTSYVYRGVSYTNRWMAFSVFPVPTPSVPPAVSGEISNQVWYQKIVYVLYQFVYGHDPVVLQVIDEAGWMSAYSAYLNAVTTPSLPAFPNVVAKSWYYGNASSLPGVGFASSDGTGQLAQYASIYDPVTNTFWTGGNDTAINTLGPLKFSSRVNPTFPAIDEPFYSVFGKFNFTSLPSYIASSNLGKTYTTDCQIVRPISPQESGAQNGPAFGKKRRIHQFAAVMNNSQGVSFGTHFNKLHTSTFTYPDGTVIPLTTLYSGTYWNTIDDDYSFEGQLAWRVTRPYPVTVVALEAYLQTQDR